jgi:transcriptional regulator with XRE-family HTH domain
MKLPARFSQAINGSPVEAPLLALAEAAGAVVSTQSTPFFPALGDCGAEAMLLAADRLVPDRFWDAEILTGIDAAVICAGCLVSNLPFFINEHGFAALVRPGSPFEPSRQDRAWPALWQGFRHEARAWSRSKLARVLGDDAFLPRVVTASDLDAHTWTLADRLLIGEFLRRHHSRLAGDIIIHGLPGTRERFQPATDMPPDLAEVISVAARARGESLRHVTSSFAHVHGGALRPAGALGLFDVAVVQIATYFRLETDVAAALLLAHPAPPPPAEIAAWRHAPQIQSISWEHADPRAVYVAVAAGRSPATYRSIRQFLVRMQSDLDSAAAVLAESYSSFPGGPLHLAHTRVVSNVDAPSLLSQPAPEPKARRRKSQAVDPQSPDSATPAFGYSIRSLRLERGLTLRQMAQRVAVSPRQVSDWERGRRYPRLDRVADIARALDIPADVLVAAAFSTRAPEVEGMQVPEPPVLHTSGVLGPDGRPLDPNDPAFERIEVVYRDVSEELLRRVGQNPELMREMHWRDFERLVADLFERDGFDVELTPRSGDKGVDLFAVRKTGLGRSLYVVQAKQHAAPIEPHFVRDFAWVIERQRATGGVLATTSRFSPGAVEEQQQLQFRMTLSDFSDLRSWLLGSPIL